MHKIRLTLQGDLCAQVLDAEFALLELKLLWRNAHWAAHGRGQGGAHARDEGVRQALSGPRTPTGVVVQQSVGIKLRV